VTTSATYLRTSREEGAKNALSEQIAGIIDPLNEDLGAAGTGSGRVGGGAGIMGLGPEGERRAVHIGSANGDLDIWRCAAGRAGTVAAVVVTGIAAEEYGGGVGTGCLFFPAAPKGPGLLVLTAPPRPPVAGDFSAAGEFSDINAAVILSHQGFVGDEAAVRNGPVGGGTHVPQAPAGDSRPSRARPSSKPSQCSRVRTRPSEPLRAAASSSRIQMFRPAAFKRGLRADQAHEPPTRAETRSMPSAPRCESALLMSADARRHPRGVRASTPHGEDVW
jgi:hypothetical protein